MLIYCLFNVEAFPVIIESLILMMGLPHIPSPCVVSFSLSLSDFFLLSDPYILSLACCKFKILSTVIYVCPSIWFSQ